MSLSEQLIKSAKEVKATLGCRLKYNLPVSLEDQEEALTKPILAYQFARDIPGADIEKCCEAACVNGKIAYYFARDIPGANIEKCKEAALKSNYWGNQFIRKLEQSIY